MKAVTRKRYGSHDLVRVVETPAQGIKNDEIKVRVHATTVNRTDTAMLTGKPFLFRFVVGLRKPKRVILGTDFAGCVEAVGEAVTKFSVGDKVWGFNDEGLCSQANYVSVQENEAVLEIPNAMTYQEIVSCAEGAHYAFNCINKVKVVPGSKVLVNGATGAIGTALLQLLKYHKAEITAVGNTKNIELMKSLGADSVIDYTAVNFLNSKQKYNFIIDAVGKTSYFKCKHLLLKGGVYISTELGAYFQNLYLPLFTKYIGNSRVVFPIPSDLPASLLFINNLIEKGCFRAVVDREYTLADAEKAYEYVLSGEKTGNVILNLENEDSL